MRETHLLSAALLIGSVLVSRSLGSEMPAERQFQALTAQMRPASSRAGWLIYRARATRLVQLLNGSPDAVIEVARAEARLGEDPKAMNELRRVAKMGLSDSVMTQRDFAALRSRRDLQPVLSQMKANAQPVSRSRQALLLPDAGILPEDIGYDSARSRFLLTSVLEKKIVALRPDGKLHDFARSPDGWPMMALRIDARRRVVWATEAALDGFANVPRASWGRSAVLEYDLSTAKLLRRIDGPKSSQLGDMALAPNGDPLVCDSIGGGVYAITKNGSSLTPVDLTDFVSPMTPAFISANEAIVADYVRGVGLLNVAAKRVDWIPAQNRFALEGIDGLYYAGARLIAMQNGISPERVVTFRLDAAARRVTAIQAIESGTTRLDPNHGTIVGSTLYFIANAGWNVLDAAGRVKKGAALTPARIMRADVSAESP